jgi:hypothetical protein
VRAVEVPLTSAVNKQEFISLFKILKQKEPRELCKRLLI